MSLHTDLQHILEKYRNERNFDPESWVLKKCRIFNGYLKYNKLTSVVVSVSGGIDSAVTLGLLKFTMELPNSNLEKIIAVNQPVQSSDWALSRAKEVCNRLDIPILVIDQTEIFNQLVQTIEKQLGISSGNYAKGQLKSYMRTPVNYYLTQLSSQEGKKCIVMGTGNMDEDGYLAYFCKAGDGVVDVQLISDIHKSEVYKVGKYFDLPKSILEAKPSADLWDGQEDEDELGFPYDFIELYTGYYLEMDDDEREEMLESLSAEGLIQFLEYEALAVEIHEKNSHKLCGVVNL